jgi:glycosyltransferase involved in cell wall biosynthesis
VIELSPGSAAREIVVISSVPPAPTTGGEIVLHRHLTQADGWNVRIIADKRRGRQFALSTRIIKRLYRTRFRRCAGSLDVLAAGRRWTVLLPTSRVASNTVVLTIADGDGCWAAQRFARKHALPLATIFHDWWPDIPTVHAPFRKVLERRFRQLYRDSDVALCVCEGMRNYLGDHRNSRILYPIPDCAGLPPERPRGSNEASAIRVHYAGNLYEYGAMLRSLLEAAVRHPWLSLQVRGGNPDWPADFRDTMRARGTWLDFAPRAEFGKWLAVADALLVTMSFDPVLRRRMETSFPSKLTEYARYGKPIIVWGPEYCSAVRWARSGHRALCVTDEDPSALVTALGSASRTPELRAHYATAARRAAICDFDPGTLQHQFLDALSTLGTRKLQVTEKIPQRGEASPVLSDSERFTSE